MPQLVTSRGAFHPRAPGRRCHDGRPERQSGLRPCGRAPPPAAHATLSACSRPELSSSAEPVRHP
eukprot:4032308-Alexandrium_andersonii.AAC.1